MNLVEQLITEALSPELVSALTAAGHTGKESHVSRAYEDPSSSIAILHDNPRAMAKKDYGYKEGKYRITFIDKEPLYKLNGSEQYAKEASPSGHISYHNPNDAVRHLGTIKQLHSAGIANNLLTPYFGINTDDFNYEPRTPRQKARGLADMADLGPDSAIPMINKVAGQEMKRDLATQRAKHNSLGLDFDENYNAEVMQLANLLTEDAMYNLLPVDAMLPQGVEEPLPRKLTYRRLAQIAASMGAATSSGF